MKYRTAFVVAVALLVALQQNTKQTLAEDPVVQAVDDPFGDPGGPKADNPFGGSDEPDDDPFGGSGGPDDDPFGEPGQVAATKVQKQQTGAATKATRSRTSIKDELLKVMDIDFDETTLEDAVQIIKEQHPFPIVIDEAALDLAGLSASDEPVTLTLSGLHCVLRFA